MRVNKLYMPKSVVSLGRVPPYRYPWQQRSETPEARVKTKTNISEAGCRGEGKTRKLPTTKGELSPFLKSSPKDQADEDDFKYPPSFKKGMPRAFLLALRSNFSSPAPIELFDGWTSKSQTADWLSCFDIEFTVALPFSSGYAFPTPLFYYNI
ncbi:hypothetical protein CEXT_165581 [Caerostris extrusa]|uniref:Uncharacterized protein n=1 Tax=Caerostris extrusa TaxID=172846 RepID=A0AAV4RNT5_CAEEX|nr:hypothetical protein CEXT_165581 [Caerostris extrusa]